MAASFVREHTGEPFATRNGRIVQVEKDLIIGPRGGLKYRNSKGNWIYLKKEQVQQCLKDKSLPGDTENVCAHVLQATSGSVKRRYGGLALQQ